jgi:hypothetical protein
MRSLITELLQRLTGAPPRALELKTWPLHGGLVSPSVHAVTANYRDARGMRQIAHWVVKQLDGSARREGAIYEALGRTSVNSMAPSLVAVEEYEGGALQLYLERVEPVDPWPWKDTTAAACVLRALARLHDSPGQELARSVRGWDYDVELQHRADQPRSSGKRTALAALRDQLRILRRADACWS